MEESESQVTIKKVTVVSSPERYGCDPYDGCNTDMCVPQFVRGGFLGSATTWVAIIVTVIVVWASVVLVDVNSEWYQSLQKPPLLIPNWLFATIWTILYVGLLIAIILAAWKTTNPRSGCMILLYTLLMLSTLCWVVGFTRFHMMSLGIVILIVIMILTLWLLWLVAPPRTSSAGWTSHVLFWIFFVWIIVALYYNIAFLVMNPGKDNQ